jgi:hypothetical protein
VTSTTNTHTRTTLIFRSISLLLGHTLVNLLTKHADYINIWNFGTLESNVFFNATFIMESINAIALKRRLLSSQQHHIVLFIHFARYRFMLATSILGMSGVC